MYSHVVCLCLGRFKDASLERLTARMSALSPDELLDLLQSSDYHQVIPGRDDVITRAALEAMLDRSELWAAWRKKQNQARDVNGDDVTDDNDDVARLTSPDVKSVFKVLSEDSNDASALTSSTPVS